MATGKRQRAAHLGPERRRPQILDAARRLALRDSLAAVTFASIAEELDVTRPTIYSCFPDRSALVDALIEREAGDLRAAVVAALLSVTDFRDAEQSFVDGLTALLRTVDTHGELWRFLLVADPDDPRTRVVASGRTEIARQAGLLYGSVVPASTEPLSSTEQALRLEFFMASCESAVRLYLTSESWTKEQIAAVYGAALRRAVFP